MTNDPPITGIRPILAIVQSNGERLLVARLTNLGASSQSNRFVLRRVDLRPPWPQPDKGYFGYAEVARALDANGWRGCAVEAMNTSDVDEMRTRTLAKRKLHQHCIAAAIDRAAQDAARAAAAGPAGDRG